MLLRQERALAMDMAASKSHRLTTLTLPALRAGSLPLPQAGEGISCEGLYLASYPEGSGRNSAVKWRMALACQAISKPRSSLALAFTSLTHSMR